MRHDLGTNLSTVYTWLFGAFARRTGTKYPHLHARVRLQVPAQGHRALVRVGQALVVCLEMTDGIRMRVMSWLRCRKEVEGEWTTDDAQQPAA